MNAVTFSGRTFPSAEIALMREIAQHYAGLGVTEIARTVCELLDWKRPSGRLKNHECRLLLEQLRDSGELTLPAVRALGGRGSRRMKTPATGGQPADGKEPVTAEAARFRDLELQLVEGAGESRLWRECVVRHHYMGCPVPYGAHLRYWVRHQGRELGCLLWTSPAWRMKARDEWIGWSDDQRRENLQRIVNNGRFLILPWVRVPHLASHVLALALKRLSGDWLKRYGHPVWLVETFVEEDRFEGTAYRAAGWLRVGQTTGRTRQDRQRKLKVPLKSVWVKPLHPRFREQLCGL